jgi:hypothetical protein
MDNLIFAVLAPLARARPILFSLPPCLFAFPLLLRFALVEAGAQGV